MERRIVSGSELVRTLARRSWAKIIMDGEAVRPKSSWKSHPAREGTYSCSFLCGSYVAAKALSSGSRSDGT